MTEMEKPVIVPLPQEHMTVLNYMRYRINIPSPRSVCRQKNAIDSVRYRQKGNDLYKMENHDEILHEKIWKTYTQSIALAPNNSEELAYGYGNRSALFFHLKQFKDCIKDCDLALDITQSAHLKVKLMTRKVESLFLLHKPTTENIAKKAIQFLKNVNLDHKLAKSYVEKLENILSVCSMMKSKNKLNQKKDEKKYLQELSNFPRSEEIPCASKSVAICYSKEWGRHIVATEYIRPGEIVAIEKNYYTYIGFGGKYLFCSHCAKPSWSSIPCEHCIFDVYCSESCRSEAWKKYHQWECPIYPFLWDIEEDTNSSPFAVRLTLIALNETGGMDNMKKLLIELDKCKDHRTKGFSEGIFQSESIRSIYSLSKNNITEDLYLDFCRTEHSCISIELLAKYTTFFGQKMNGTTSDIFKNKDVLFVAALMLYTHHITHKNIVNYTCQKIVSDGVVKYSASIRAFGSLINHSCDPNIYITMGQNDVTFAFALKPIKKGTQLVYSYIGRNFLDNPKAQREAYLESFHSIKCQCIPCLENWSNICLPTMKTICEVTPALKVKFCGALNKMSKLMNVRFDKDTVYSPELIRDITLFLEFMAENITMHCGVCEKYIEILAKIMHEIFGNFHFTVPNKCYLH